MLLSDQSFIDVRLLLLLLLFVLYFFMFFLLLLESHFHWFKFIELNERLFQSISTVDFIIQDLLIFQLDSNMFSITFNLLNDCIPLNLLLFQNNVLLFPVPMDHPVDNFNMCPWLHDDVINGLDEFLLLFINVPVKVTHKTFVFISIKLSQHSSVVAESCYLQ